MKTDTKTLLLIKDHPERAGERVDARRDDGVRPLRLLHEEGPKAKYMVSSQFDFVSLFVGFKHHGSFYKTNCPSVCNCTMYMSLYSIIAYFISRKKKDFGKYQHLISVTLKITK